MPQTSSLITEDPIYHPNNIKLFTKLYGEHLISLGGTPAIKHLFAGLNIHGLTALDFGFGLGGVTFYAAEQYNLHIEGLERQPWMVDYAETHIPAQLRKQLKFSVYDANDKFPYPPASFDLVYSKGVFNHIHEKSRTLQQIHTVLKSGGLLVIADWLFPDNTMEKNDLLATETKKSYQKLLTSTGFEQITFRDDSEAFLNYTQQFVDNLTQNQEFIEKNYPPALYQEILTQHQTLIEKITKQEKFAMRITAIAEKKINLTAKSAQSVQAALAKQGLSYNVVEFSAPTRTAQDAAAAIGCEIGQIVKSLIFKTQQTQQPVLILASGINRVNEKLIAEQLGEPIIKADADSTRKITGYAIGGIPPIGHQETINFIFIDKELLNFPYVWAAAGTPNAVFQLTSKDLLAITQGKVIAVT